MSWLRRCILLTGALLLGLQWAAGCGDSGNSKGGAGRDSEGLRMCCELGAICHEVGQQDEDEDACHELAHENNPSECRANYDRCMEICAPAGEGGQGGEAEEHACVKTE